MTKKELIDAPEMLYTATVSEWVSGSGPRYEQDIDDMTGVDIEITAYQACEMFCRNLSRESLEPYGEEEPEIDLWFRAYRVTVDCYGEEIEREELTDAWASDYVRKEVIL